MAFVNYSTLPPAMGELLCNSYPIYSKFNGLACQNPCCMPSNYDGKAHWRIFHCNLHHCAALNKSRDFMRLCQFFMVPVFSKGNAWFDCVQFNLRQSNSTSDSTRMASLTSLPIPDLVAGDESGLVFEENKETRVAESAKDELDLDSFEQHLPPWGNEGVPQELVVDSESIVEPSVNSRNTASVNVSNVYLLEETNEEELSARILTLSRSNKVRSALELFRSMEISGLKPKSHACNSLLACLVRNKLLDHAFSVFEFMRRNEISTGHTYTLILKAVADLHGFESSLSMFAELGGFSGTENGFDVIVYNTMISICGRVNNWVETERLWRSMKDSGCNGTEVTYSLLISIFVRCSKNELALNAYNEMEQNGTKPRDDTLQAIIGALTKEGRWDLALTIFQNMLNHGLKPNLVTCNALMNSLGKAGEFKLAFKVFEKATTLGHIPDAYTWNALLNGLYRANQLASVLQLFESIKREQSSQINEHLYNNALMSCQKLGLWSKSLQLLWQLEASGLPVSTTSYNLVLGACERARKPKVALQVYEHMIHRKYTPDTFTHLSLIRSCIWASLWDELEEILEITIAQCPLCSWLSKDELALSLQQVEPDVSIYNAVIHGMCLRGKFESAKKLYMKMCRSGLKPDGKTRALMLQNLRRRATRPRR